MDESIDDCITRRRRECTEPIWHTVPYLCGNEKVCLKKYEQTIQITKQRIDSKYLVIGVLEQLKVHLILISNQLDQNQTLGYSWSSREASPRLFRRCRQPIRVN